MSAGSAQADGRAEADRRTIRFPGGKTLANAERFFRPGVPGWRLLALASGIAVRHFRRARQTNMVALLMTPSGRPAAYSSGNLMGTPRLLTLDRCP